MAREELKKQRATSTTTVMESFKTEVLGMLTFMDVDSFTCACAIMALVVPKQKTDNLKPLLKYILRQLDSEDAEGCDDGGSSWYKKLLDHFE